MDKEFSEKELNELAKQLSCPSGKTGLAVAEQMNKSNISMTLATIEESDLKDGQFVLELGHGNGEHLDLIFHQALDLHYFGLEVSKLMKEAAERNNDVFLINEWATFSLYDGLKLPFDEDIFDVIFTVNTIYFWTSPIQLLKDIHRVLKKGGTCYITFAQKKFMQGLSFTKNEFTMYDDNDIVTLISKTPFKLIDIINKSEQVRSKTGEVVKRDYAIVCLEA
ncbi:MAG: class I SAM-dependent methyltransferase [Aureispira sp.]|nr:class I SAM-dependent methyltransferase [Aureispira sp.]